MPPKRRHSPAKLPSQQGGSAYKKFRPPGQKVWQQKIIDFAEVEAEERKEEATAENLEDESRSEEESMDSLFDISLENWLAFHPTWEILSDYLRPT